MICRASATKPAGMVMRWAVSIWTAGCPNDRMLVSNCHCTGRTTRTAVSQVKAFTAEDHQLKIGLPVQFIGNAHRKIRYGFDFMGDPDGAVGPHHDRAACRGLREQLEQRARPGRQNGQRLRLPNARADGNVRQFALYARPRRILPFSLRALPRDREASVRGRYLPLTVSMVFNFPGTAAMIFYSFTAHQPPLYRLNTR